MRQPKELNISNSENLTCRHCRITQQRSRCLSSAFTVPSFGFRATKPSARNPKTITDLMNGSHHSPRDKSLPEVSKSPSVRECLRALQRPIRFLKGVGPKRSEQLEAFSRSTIEDLLYHLPFRYEDRREIQKLRHAIVGKEASFVGQLAAVESKYIPRRRSQIITATLRDDTASIGLIWYRAPSYISKSVSNGQTLLVHGKVEQSLGGQKRIVHPDFEVLEPGADGQSRILPIYVRPGGLPLSLLRKWMLQAVSECTGYVPNCL